MQTIVMKEDYIQSIPRNKRHSVPGWTEAEVDGVVVDWDGPLG